MSWVLAASLAVTAAWVSLGRLHHLQHADSLVPVLTSLQRWTFFYWEQDRIGMLVPLLAMPIRDPLANMIVQSALNTFAALASGFLLVRYLLGPAPFWAAAAALANVWFVLLIPGLAQFEWFVGLPQYPVALSLGLVALLALEARWIASALLCVLLANWLNPTIFLLLLSLAVVRHLVEGGRSRLIGAALLIAAGTMGGAAMFLVARPHRTAYGGAFDPPSLWPGGWLSLARMTRQHVLPDWGGLLWVLAPAAAGLLLVLWWRRGEGRRRVLVVASGLAVTALLYALLMGSLPWVRMNAYAPRYLAPSLLLAAVALALVAVAPLESAGRRGGVIALVAMASMLGAVGLVYGRPSAGAVAQTVDQQWGRLTRDVIDSGATLVAGNYWVVWPAVFHANLALHRRGESRAVYGLTFRDTETRPLWAHRGGLCVAVPLGDREAGEYVARSGLRLRPDRRYATIETLCSGGQPG